MNETERNAVGGRLKYDMMRPMAKPQDDSYPTRSSLLRRVKDTHDQQSWQEFSDIYSKLILGFAIKAGLTEDEAQEVVQETLIAAAKHLPKFRYDPKICSFKTWLLNLTKWRMQDQLRKRQAPGTPRAPQVRDGSGENASRTPTINRIADPAGPELERIWDKEWRVTLMEAAIARVKFQVDLKQWQIFDLYALKEWSVKEVARNLGVSTGRVYLTKHRVSALLKRELRKLEKTC